MSVCIFTIVKNEQDYLDEWIIYHLSLGIDKIYIFEDDGSLSHASICDKYDKVVLDSIYSVFYGRARDIINRIPLQVRYMISCLNYIKEHDSFDWVTYIDVDEFITLENKSDTLDSVLNAYSDYNMLCVQWKNFGASGHIHKPIGNCVDVYTTECALYTGSKMSSFASSKLFFNMHFYGIRKIKFNHHIPYGNLYWCKTDFSVDLKSAVYDKIYLRHYITKSFEEFCKKIFVRGQFNDSKDLRIFFKFNPDIDINDPDVKTIIDDYYDRFMSGELDYCLKV